MTMRVRHIPAVMVDRTRNYQDGLYGTAMCGRWARYATADLRLVREAYRDPRNREGACKDCVTKFTRAMSEESTAP